MTLRDPSYRHFSDIMTEPQVRERLFKSRLDLTQTQVALFYSFGPIAGRVFLFFDGEREYVMPMEDCGFFYFMGWEELPPVLQKTWQIERGRLYSVKRELIPMFHEYEQIANYSPEEHPDT